VNRQVQDVKDMAQFEEQMRATFDRPVECYAYAYKATGQAAITDHEHNQQAAIRN